MAAWLAAAGARRCWWGGSGTTSAGARRCAALRDAGVDAGWRSTTERPTGTCVVLVLRAGERTMMPDPGANDALGPEDLPDELLAAGAHLHVAGYALLRRGLASGGALGDRARRERGMTVSVDPSSAALLSPAFLELARRRRAAAAERGGGAARSRASAIPVARPARWRSASARSW